jgi:radical SAM superfamily enzyme YgiQ (UPF0313 family)
LNILLVYPRYPDTFWSFKHALKFISKKAAYPPLGLLTVASMLPTHWKKKLVDLNTDSLKDADISWADYVFISAMGVQQQSVRDVIRRCNQQNVKIVAGGPLFATDHEQYQQFNGVDHFVLGEGEAVIARLVADLENGTAQHIYNSEERPDIRKSPRPDWNLIDISKYATLTVQYSRGCPFNCDFCDIVLLNGHVPRTKDPGQLVAEMEAIYSLGWRQSVFIVDDNFIGNKKKLKTELLPAIITWMKERDYPFTLFTQASIGLSDDDELMRLMVDAGFDRVFIGIETPNEDSLGECNFIQQTGIVTAMVGLLNAPPGTNLYKRLKNESRLIGQASGDNTDFSINFVPKMGHESLINGYRRTITAIYSPRQYYARIGTLMREHRPVSHKRNSLKLAHVEALLKSIWYLGIMEKGRTHYWRLFTSTLFKRPHAFPLAITLAIYGYHFRKLIASYTRGLPRAGAPR